MVKKKNADVRTRRKDQKKKIHSEFHENKQQRRKEQKEALNSRNFAGVSRCVKFTHPAVFDKAKVDEFWRCGPKLTFFISPCSTH